MTEPPIHDVLWALAIREVPRTSPRQVREWLAGAGALAPRDRMLVEAAVALRSGWPSRVDEGLAQADDRSLAATLRIAAGVNMRNRFPGGRGAVFEEGDVEQLEEPPVPSLEPPAEAVLMLAFGHVDAMVGNWRSVARDGGAEGARLAVGRVQHLRAVAAGAPWLAAYLALVEADVRRLAGDAAGASAAWKKAANEFAAAGDALGVAAAHVAAGDWHAAPRSSPEVLDLVIDLSPTPSTTEPDLAAARSSYDVARAIYEQAGCDLGLANVALRDGFVAARAGDVAGWHAAAARAEALAAREQDDWVAILAAVHGALAAIAAGGTADEARLAGWAGRLQADGGRAWARGLVRLVVAQASALRDGGQFVAARRALGVARAMAEATGAPREVVDVTDRLLDLYGRTSFPAPRAVLELASVHAALATLDATSDPLAWAGVANRAISAMGMATQVADGDLVTAAGELAARVAAAAPPPDPVSTWVVSTLMESAAQARVLGPLYAARAARRDGFAERAEPLERQALAAAEAMRADGRFLRAIVLGTIGRKVEALAIVEELRAELPADQLRLLYVRLGATAQALWLLPPVDPPSARPWEALSLRAQIYCAEGRPAEAAATADAGIAAFEDALTTYARDALKTSATEDLDAADLYLARIVADASAAETGDRGALHRTFAMSDRARSISNVERIGTDHSEPAVRHWLALGSRWAAEHESFIGAVTDLGAIDVAAARGRLRVVEDELDDAEDELLRARPDLVSMFRARRPPLDLDQVAAAVPWGGILLQYHCWDDQVLVWALTGDDLRFSRTEIDAKAVASDGRRFLRACSGRDVPEPAVAERLGRLLLEPWAALLDEHERVVLVPHGALSGVPIHLLPAGGRMLADDHVVSYVPSASQLTFLAAGPTPTPGRALVVGDPAYAAARGLRRLPGSGVEALASAAVLPDARVLVGPAATRDAVLRDGAGATVVHLGTHGLLDERAPNRSFLALAGDDALTAADLFSLDLDGAMAVFSACDSGRGTATAGGDVIGLIRAVLASGAGSVVASLWPVGDEAGCLIMSRFYEHLTGAGGAASVPAAKALHDAAADVRAMPAPDRRAAYQELATRFGASGPPAGVRDVRPGGVDVLSAETSIWAPFVFVGR